MNKKVSILIFIFLILLAGAAYYFLNRPVDSAITGTGMIEITQADLTPKVSGYLVERNFKEGDQVEKGQIIARISKVDLALQYNQTVGCADIHIDTKRIDNNIRNAQKLLNMQKHY